MIKSYNPDVLTCLANLSNDEVFTPPHIANQMLDTLPQELFSNPKTKFLDPFSKSGVFLREIAKRLLKGLESQIPDLQERIDHIMHHQLYGIGITELTALLTRRSLYCASRANSKHSVTAFGDDSGNIYFKEIPHSWNKDGKCTYCGATEREFSEDQREGLAQHAYNFIHNDNPYQDMQFDVIIGNPPYQLSDGGGGDGGSAMPIYHLFIQQAIKLNPHYLCMIVPSRWMKGGRGLNAFRQDMMNDTRLKYICDFESADKVFTGIRLDGGVCYFLWDKEYNGKCYFEHTTLEGEIVSSERYLKTEISDTVIRDFRQISIIEKSQQLKEERFSEIVSPQKPFGFRADFFNKPERYPDIKVEKDPQPHLCKIYGVKGIKGTKRVVGYINRRHIHKSAKSIDKYKLFFSKAYSTTATVPPEIIVGENGTICTETFLKIGDFNTKSETLNCLSYIKTKFFRALLFFNRHSLNISQESFVLIPMQDFSKPWTDDELYAKYGLTEEEITYIEKMVRPME